MTEASGQERWSATTGVAAVVLWAAGVLVIGGGHVGFPGGMPEESADDVLAFYADGADRVIAGTWVFMLGALCFVAFVVRLSTVLAAGRPEPDLMGLARSATATGVVTGVLVLLTAAAGLVAALGAEHLEAAAAQALDATSGVFFVGAEMTGVAMLAALALLARRTGALPSAWSSASLALAVWLAVLPIGWVGLILGVPVWTLATAVLLGRPPAARPRSAEFDAGARSVTATARG